MMMMLMMMMLKAFLDNQSQLQEVPVHSIRSECLLNGHQFVKIHRKEMHWSATIGMMASGEEARCILCWSFN